MTSFPSSKRTSIPVRTGRDSSREAERLTFAIVSRNGRAVDRELPSPPDLRQAREVLGAVRVEAVRRGAAREVHDALLRRGARASPRRAAGAARCRRGDGPGRRPLPPPRPSRRARARSEISMSVAASASRPASARSRIPVRMWTLVRVETPRPTTRELLGKLLATTGNLHVGGGNCIERISFKRPRSSHKECG